MMEGETRRSRCPSTCAAAGRVRGLRGYAAAEARSDCRRGRAIRAGLTHAAELSQMPLLPEDARRRRAALSRRAASTRTCSRSTCAAATHGDCCWHEVPSVELLEVQLVNAVAPFILNARLEAADAARRPSATSTSSTCRRWKVSSTARFKTTRHPHTNMAKAALNMMTRTSAADYHARRHSHEQRGHRLGDRRRPGRDRRPQDASSSASIRRSTSWTARRGSWTRSSAAFMTGRHVWGQFLKDYQPTDW